LVTKYTQAKFYEYQTTVFNFVGFECYTQTKEVIYA